MPWLGKVETPFGKESRRVLTQASIVRGCVMMTDLFRTSLGPKGMVKLLVQPFPMRNQVTADGKTILTSLGSIHPAAWILREMAYSQINVGDGVITMLVLAGELLKNAKKLLDQKVKPPVIAQGYLEAYRFALKAMAELSVPVRWDDEETMRRVALTAAGTKSTGLHTIELAEFASAAVRYVTEMRGGYPYIDIGNICVVKMPGKPSDASRLVRGIVLERGLRHPSMPKRLEDVRIALLTCGLEFRKFWEETATVKIELAPGQMSSMTETRHEMVGKNVEKIVSSGANVVVAKHGIDELHASLLARKGIQGLQRIPDAGGIGRLARASGGTPVATLDDLRPGDLGRAAVAEEIRVPRYDTRRLERDVKTPDGHKLPEEERIFMIDGCTDPKSVTILLRAELEATLTESERALDAAIAACQALVRDPRIVGGAGAVEAELARRVRDFALTFEDKVQLAVMAYADSLEGMVEALAENAGIDPLDAKFNVRAAHSNGETWMGMDLFAKCLRDAFEMGVVEPIRIKESAIMIASEAACQLVRIDRILRGDRDAKLIPGEIPPGASEGPDVLTDAKDLPDETIKRFRESKFLKPYGSKLKLNL